MGVYTVARDDFRNAARSYTVAGVVAVFALLVALIFVTEAGTFDDPYRTLFDVELLMVFLAPIVLAPLTYLCIAGDRASGTIKFTMGLPNTHGQYVAGKFLSRLGVAAAAVVVSVLIGFVISLTTYANAPDIGRFLAFAGATGLFVLAWVGLFVAVSAATEKRSRAMIAVFGLYFLFVPFWFGMIGPVSLQAVVEAVADLLGLTLSDSAKGFILSLSPAWAYMQAARPVYAGVVDQYATIQSNYGGSTAELWAKPWYNALVLVGWSAVSLAVGYLKFTRSELQ